MSLGIDFADVLILGWHDKVPKQAIFDAAKELKERGPLSAAQCYRFEIPNPLVDVTLTGQKNEEELECALLALTSGALSDEEMSRALSIGRHVHDTRTLGDRLNPLV